MLSEGYVEERGSTKRKKGYLSEELGRSPTMKNSRHKSLMKKSTTSNLKCSINQELIKQEAFSLDPEYEALRVFSKYGSALLHTFMYVPILKATLNPLQPTTDPKEGSNKEIPKADEKDKKASPQCGIGNNNGSISE